MLDELDRARCQKGLHGDCYRGRRMYGGQSGPIRQARHALRRHDEEELDQALRDMYPDRADPNWFFDDEGELLDATDWNDGPPSDHAIAMELKRTNRLRRIDLLTSQLARIDQVRFEVMRELLELGLTA